MTASQSGSVIVTIIRSRRMPALFTTTSSPPNVSVAWPISRCAPAQVEMSSVFATASPPAAVISSATAWAGPDDEPAAVAGAAQVVDDDLGALRGEGQGVRPADPVPGASNDHDAPGACSGRHMLSRLAWAGAQLVRCHWF